LVNYLCELCEKNFFPIKWKEITFKILTGHRLYLLIFIETAFALRQKMDRASRAVFAVYLRVAACQTILTHVYIMFQAGIAGFFFRVVHARCQFKVLLFSEA
jgi:hypothetical protein